MIQLPRPPQPTQPILIFRLGTDGFGVSAPKIFTLPSIDIDAMAAALPRSSRREIVESFRSGVLTILILSWWSEHGRSDGTSEPFNLHCFAEKRVKPCQHDYRMPVPGIQALCDAVQSGYVLAFRCLGGKSLSGIHGRNALSIGQASSCAKIRSFLGQAGTVLRFTAEELGKREGKDRMAGVKSRPSQEKPEVS